MIVIRAEVWPHGEPPDSPHGRDVAESGTPLGVFGCVVVNNGQGNRDHGFYDVYACDPAYPNNRKSWLRIGGFDNERHAEHRSEITQRGIDIFRAWDEAGCPS